MREVVTWKPELTASECLTVECAIENGRFVTVSESLDNARRSEGVEVEAEAFFAGGIFGTHKGQVSKCTWRSQIQVRESYIT